MKRMKIACLLLALVMVLPLMFAGCSKDRGGKGNGGPDVVGSDANYDTLVSTYASRLEAARKALIKYVENISADD